MNNIAFDETITPIFGLRKAQLKPIVDNIICNDTIASFDVTIEHQVSGRYYGARGEKVIPTFTYRTYSGRTGRNTIFAKKYYEPSSREAWHYNYLTKHQAPIPRIYGTLINSSRREILFLEFLDIDTDNDSIFVRDTNKFCQFLAVVAKLNAIQPSIEYAEQLQDKDVGGALGGRVLYVLDSIWKQACKGKLGDVMKYFCSNSQDKLGRLKMLAKRLIKPIRQMDRGLCVNDCYPHCTGCRFDTGERLIFDLEFVSFSPRFRDIAPWLGAPDDIESYCLPRIELAQHYLKHYLKWGGSYVKLDQFFYETNLLWMSWTFGQLNRWYFKALNNSELGYNLLYKKLADLLSQT